MRDSRYVVYQNFHPILNLSLNLWPESLAGHHELYGQEIAHIVATVNSENNAPEIVSRFLVAVYTKGILLTFGSR